ARFSVHGEVQLQASRIVDLVGGANPRTRGHKGVVALAPHHLHEERIDVDVGHDHGACRDIVTEHVPRDERECILATYPPPLTSDHDGKLDLVVELSGLAGAHDRVRG